MILCESWGRRALGPHLLRQVPPVGRGESTGRVIYMAWYLWQFTATFTRPVSPQKAVNSKLPKMAWNPEAHLQEIAL